MAAGTSENMLGIAGVAPAGEDYRTSNDYNPWAPRNALGQQPTHTKSQELFSSVLTGSKKR